MAAPQPEATSEESVGEEGDRCLRFAGPPGDPDLRGQARMHAVRCCPSGYGFEPELARQSCGFEAYLGESEELACVHRFRDGDGWVHELRVTPMVDVGFEKAVALHEHGGLEGEEAAEGVWWSAAEGRRWAYVPGWPIVRRLGWDEDACAPERMLPVLEKMAGTEVEPGVEVEVALPRVMDEGEGADEAATGGLLEREWAVVDGRRYPLPRAAELLVEDLMAAVAAEDAGGLARVIEPGARIGLPDRRELGARAMLGSDGGKAALGLLRRAAARFPGEAELICPAIDRRARARVSRGEVMMWCYWASGDGLDWLVVGLRGRVVDGEADGRVEYVGVFPERPVAGVMVPGEPPPPPLLPLPSPRPRVSL